MHVCTCFYTHTHTHMLHTSYYSAHNTFLIKTEKGPSSKAFDFFLLPFLNAVVLLPSCFTFLINLRDELINFPSFNARTPGRISVYNKINAMDSRLLWAQIKQAKPLGSPCGSGDTWPSHGWSDIVEKKETATPTSNSSSCQASELEALEVQEMRVYLCVRVCECILRIWSPHSLKYQSQMLE